MSSNASLQDHLNGHSGFIIAVFVVVSIFVIWPLKIPVIQFVQRPFLAFLRVSRIITNNEYEELRVKTLHFPLSLETAPVIGVLLLLLSTTINSSTIVLGVKGDASVKPYDVLVLFISLAYISIALDGTGALEAIAFWVSRRGGESGLLLFTYLYCFFLGVGCIVGNDPLILSGTPFLAYLTHHTKLDPTPWVFSEFMAANTASAVLVSSNPTNVLITGSFNLNYLTDFTKYTVLPSIIPAIINYPILLAMFWKKIPRTLTPLKDNPWSKLRDPVGAVFFSSLLVVTVIILVGTSFVPGHAVEVWMVTAPAGIIALSFDLGSDWWYHHKLKQDIKSGEADEATDMTVSRITSRASSYRRTLSENVVHRQKSEYEKRSDSSSPETKDKSDIHVNTRASLTQLIRSFQKRFPGSYQTITRLPLPLLPFAICEFILVRGLAQRDWISVFAQGFANACTTPLRTVFFFGFVSAAFLCPLAGTNIGATILLVEVLQSASFQQSAAVLRDPKILTAAIYSVAMGSNIGAFSYTFAGSLAGLLWRKLLSDKDVDISQAKFALINLLPLLMQITVASAIIYGEIYWFA